MFSENVHVVTHPLVSHKLTILRDKDTATKDFRELVSEIGMLLTYEATRDLPLVDKEVETPICKTMAPTLRGKKFAVVPILRAGLGLVEGVLRMVPSARVGHIGLYRNEDTLEPVKYFCKMPKDVAERDVLIVDPMLATGGSAAAAIGFMKEYGCANIKLMVLLAAPEGNGGRRFSIGEGDPVLSCTLREDHYGVLTEVLVIDKTRNAYYSVKNEDMIRRGGQCRRVVYTPGQSTWDAMRYTGEYQIRRSKENERTVTLCLPGSFPAFPGDRVDLRLERMGLSGSFRVAEAANTFSAERGATAALTLKGG